MPTPHRLFFPPVLSGRLGSLGRGLALALVALSLTAGCQKSKAKSDQTATTAPAVTAGSGALDPAAAAAAAAKDIDSKDILARTEVAQEAEVKHVLVAWKDLAAAYGGKLDPRAEKRTNEEAAKLANEIAATLRAKPDEIDAQIKTHSEDPGSLEGNAYSVQADSPFVPEFKQLALRLKEKEIGIVRTNFGYHVMERMPPPPTDPIESSDIMARAPETEPRMVRHVLIAWKDAPATRKRPPDPRAAARTKEQADKLAVELLARVKKGEDIVKLMKEFSEDPGSKDSGRTYPVDERSALVMPFKKLAMRLKMDEAGLVKTDFGWHVIKRVPPPPPDKLESAAVLARKPATDKADVKHILLGWTEVHAEDPRGTKRTRAELEALVKKTVAALQKGAKIEPLMTELSEDPGSAKSGESYPVTPDAGLVQPFKDLSLRLNLNEVGVVKTDFGIHIIQRVK
jgi:parvulin-like peptidyl-prolyl isomerase